MDGIHDFGGKHGFGEVEIDDYPAGFVERWHGAVFTMVNAAFYCGAAKNTDHFRHSVERIDPVSYLTDGYYGRWLGGVETMLVEAGVISQEELDAKAQALGASTHARVAARPLVKPDKFDGAPDVRSASSKRELERAPKFAPGDQVSTRATASAGHTRLPAYARGVVGVVERYQGAWVLPDAAAHGQQGVDHLYSIRFPLETLFAANNSEPATEVYLDLFESYLQHA